MKKKTSPAPAPKADSARRKRQRVTAAATPDEREGKSRTYAPPEKYAHLNGVPDALAPGLVLLLVGLNPGITTATVGHAYVPPFLPSFLPFSLYASTSIDVLKLK